VAVNLKSRQVDERLAPLRQTTGHRATEIMRDALEQAPRLAGAVRGTASEAAAF
jgi:hypothetical protein